MRHVDLGLLAPRDQPVPRQRNPFDPRRIRFHRFFPGRKVDRAGERRQHHELCERDSRALRQLRRQFEGLGTVARQPEDERAEHVHAVVPEGAQPIDQLLAAVVEVLVDVLQPLRRHRFDSDQRALDVGFLHRREEIGIFGRFHRDLREEDHVVGQLGQRFHQLEALGAHRLELLESALVGAPRRFREIVERDGIEIVVGQRDETEPAPAQIDDFADHRVDGPLPRPLAVGLPHRAEGTVLRAAAHGLHRRPHVFAGRNQRPPGRLEITSLDLAAVVHRQRRALDAVLDHLRPHQIAVALDDGVRLAEPHRFVGIEGGVNAAVDDVCATLAHDFSDAIAVHRIARMDADTDDIPGGDGRRVPWIQGFIGDQRIAVLLWRRRGQDVEPPRRNNPNTER